MFTIQPTSISLKTVKTWYWIKHKNSQTGKITRNIVGSQWIGVIGSQCLMSDKKYSFLTKNSVQTKWKLPSTHKLSIFLVHMVQQLSLLSHTGNKYWIFLKTGQIGSSNLHLRFLCHRLKKHYLKRFQWLWKKMGQ